MFGVIPRVMWEKRIKPDERNTIALGLNSLLVRTGTHNVLIETGIGNKLTEKLHAIHRNEALLMRSFERAGVSRTRSISSSTRICTSIIAAGTPTTRTAS